MDNICPLLIHTSFIGRTYHSFQLKFESPAVNCTRSPLLIEFAQIVNQTFNETTYVLHDHKNDLLQLPVFQNDRVDLCIRSSLDSVDDVERTCHTFYMITMLTSEHDSHWPLLLTGVYVMLLVMFILLSFAAQCWTKLSRSFEHVSFGEKIQETLGRLFYQRRQRADDLQRRTLSDKKDLLKVINQLARECRTDRRPHVVSPVLTLPTDTLAAHVNKAFA